jgi:predicted AAA+ superfamily ATPase
VREDLHYYIEPKETIESLGKYLRSGKFCLLYGHRQSGKTTIIYAIEKWLVNNFDKEVYIMDFSSGIIIDGGLETFWKSVCKKLRSLDRNRFSFNEQEEISSSTFESLFSKLNHPNVKESIIIIDEASYIGGGKIAQDFIRSLRVLKEGSFNLHSILLAGTELIKEFLVSHQQVGSASIISPFSAKAILTPIRFKQAEIQELLHQYSSDEDFELDINEIAKEIYLLTYGHKGLVGSCCSYIEDNMMVGKCKLTLDDWNKESYKLTKYIRRQATYESITRTLPYLSKSQRNILGNVLFSRTFVDSMVSALTY